MKRYLPTRIGLAAELCPIPDTLCPLRPTTIPLAFRGRFPRSEHPSRGGSSVQTRKHISHSSDVRRNDRIRRSPYSISFVLLRPQQDWLDFDRLASHGVHPAHLGHGLLLAGHSALSQLPAYCGPPSPRLRAKEPSRFACRSHEYRFTRPLDRRLPAHESPPLVFLPGAAHFCIAAPAFISVTST